MFNWPNSICYDGSLWWCDRYQGKQFWDEEDLQNFLPDSTQRPPKDNKTIESKHYVIAKIVKKKSLGAYLENFKHIANWNILQICIEIKLEAHYST